MNQEMNPMGQPEKKGMSKGCLVGLIVGIVLVVLVAGIALTVWYKWDDIKKAGVVTVAESLRTELNDNPVEGVDTVQVNRVTDGFLAKLDTDQVTIEQLSQFMQSVQSIMADQAVDAEEADIFVQAMMDYYPDLAELAPVEESMEDTSAVADSLEQTD